MKRLLITGSAGFIGTHAVAAAEAHGWEVHCADIKTGDDIRAVDSIVSEGYDCILHLAAFSSNAGFAERMAANYETNVDAFHRVLRVAKGRGARLLYASSSAVYPGNSDCGLPDSEDDLLDTEWLRSHYAKSKLINEMMAESYRAIGLNCLGLRIFNAYGPGDALKPFGRRAPPTWMQLDKAIGRPTVIYGDGTQAKDFIHVYDVVEIIMRLLESDAQGVVNVGTGVATSFNALTDLIGVGREYEPVPDPESYQYFTRADTARLLSIIGPYRFTTLEQGLK